MATQPDIADYVSVNQLAMASKPVPLSIQQAQMRGQLDAIAAQKLSIWDGGNLQVDDASTANITSWATQATLAVATGAAFGLQYWIMADNSHRAFTGAADYLAFAQGALAYKTAVVLQYSALKQAIAGAPDATTLAAISISAGWPT